jgi:murein DD-endopeptidase MepM/ murein hydrolase activator NlpD
MTHWKDYTYHPLHLDPVKIGFKHGQRYPAGFNSLTGQRHLGQDYICKVGTPVYAIADGSIKISTGKQSGLMITLITNTGLSVRIMHLNTTVKHNGMVKRGDLIAYSGNTGTSTVAHSHIDIFEGVPTNINQFSKFIDPLTLNYQIKEEDMETKEIRAIVEGIYWSFAMRQPDKGGVDFWVEEYKREGEKSKWLARILEGLRGEKIAQKPEALRYLDAKENVWKTKNDVFGE